MKSNKADFRPNIIWRELLTSKKKDNPLSTFDNPKHFFCPSQSIFLTGKWPQCLMSTPLHLRMVETEPCDIREHDVTYSSLKRWKALASTSWNPTFPPKISPHIWKKGGNYFPNSDLSKCIITHTALRPQPHPVTQCQYSRHSAGVYAPPHGHALFKHLSSPGWRGWNFLSSESRYILTDDPRLPLNPSTHNF